MSKIKDIKGFLEEMTLSQNPSINTNRQKPRLKTDFGGTEIHTQLATHRRSSSLTKLDPSTKPPTKKR